LLKRALRRGLACGPRIALIVNIPNLLSLLRILLAPLTIWLIISGEPGWAFATALIAGVTDALDGWLAKRFGWETELGAYLDPLADKILLVGVFASLGFEAALPAWLVILVISRDVMIVCAILLAQLLGRPIRMQPMMLSKFNTAAQIALAVITLADMAFALGWLPLRTLLIVLVAVLTVTSAMLYARTWLRLMSGPTPAHDEGVSRGDRQ
jgi:cardiolipin synthase (CMP-forming)